MEMSVMESSDENSGRLKLQTVRRKWSRQETDALVEYYKTRIKDVQPRQKILVYKNIVDDLNNSGIMETPVTVDEVQNKIKSLIRAYKDIGLGKSYGNATIEPYLDDLKEILGSGGYQMRTRNFRGLEGAYFIRYDEDVVEDDSQIDLIIPDYCEVTESDPEESNEVLPTVSERVPVPVRVPEQVQQATSANCDNKETEIKEKWERKRKLVEYCEHRKDRRLMLKLDFLREKEKNRMLRHEEERKWRFEMLEVFKQFANSEKTEKCNCTKASFKIKAEKLF